MVASTTILASSFPERTESFLGGLLFVKDGDHYSGCTTCFSDLQESMWVFLSLFAIRAEVKILAHTALVAVADDGADVASIAADAVMDNWACCFL